MIKTFEDFVNEGETNPTTLMPGSIQESIPRS